MKKITLSLLSLLVWSMPLFAQNYNIELRSTLSFPGQTLANVCGYTQDGREYALVGASKGLVIVEITNPDVPVQIVQIPGPDNLWKEIKTYSHYAYVTSEGGGGVQIVDLANLPSANLSYHSYKGDGAIANQLNTIHALHIDVTKGFLYAYGSNLFQGGAVVLNLNADPYNPTYAGKFDQLAYIHDGFADNDTLYGGHIYTGLLSVVDMSDKQNPVLLGTVQTPGKFTHNSWLLDDHKHILTTDETTPSFLTSYDLSDPSDIQELDRISPNDGYDSYVHNTHVLNDYGVTSWYTDGVYIVDAHRPGNLIITGYYDTYAGSGAQFDGCWGVYPFFPSGTMIASNIEPGELFILTPTYVRACYLEGTITNGCDGSPLADAQITFSSNAPQSATKTKNDGTFKTGQAADGAVTVTISKPGFISQTIPVNFVHGEVTPLNITLEPVSSLNITGTIVDAETNLPIANAPIIVQDLATSSSSQIIADNQGQFQLSCAPAGEYVVSSGNWGYLPSEPINIASSGNYTVSLQHGYYDDFAFDYVWNTTASSTSGAWVRDVPIGTSNQNNYCNPANDVDFDGNQLCYITGNAGGSASADDVDNGEVVLSCPAMSLSNYNAATLSFWYWFYNAGGQGAPNDKLTVQATNGSQTITVFEQTVSASEWRYSGEIKLENFITLNDQVKIRFITSDLQGSGNLVEAGVDVFKVVPKTASSAQEAGFDPNALLQITPNPSSDAFTLSYTVENTGQAVLEVYNLLGQSVIRQEITGPSGAIRFGEQLPKGAYTVRLYTQQGGSRPVQIIKQ